MESIRNACLGFILLLLSCVVLCNDNQETSTKQTPGRTTIRQAKPAITTDDGSGDIHGAWAYTQLFIERDYISTPRTAKYPFGGAVKYVTDMGNGMYRVDAYVDCQNDFGAMVRRKFVAKIEKLNRGKRWKLHEFTWKH